MCRILQNLSFQNKVYRSKFIIIVIIIIIIKKKHTIALAFGSNVFFSQFCDIIKVTIIHRYIYIVKFDDIQNMKIQNLRHHVVGNCGNFFKLKKFEMRRIFRENIKIPKYLKK
jgi:hypothetical protein